MAVVPIPELQSRTIQVALETAAGGNSNRRVGNLLRDMVDTLSTGGLGGNVTGPASSLDGEVVLFDGLTGKIVKNSGIVVAELVTQAGDGLQKLGHVVSVLPDGGTIVASPTGTKVADGGILDLQINANAGISISKLATIAALSVLVNATNAVAVPTALAATNDNTLLMRQGAALVWSTIGTANIADGSVTLAKLQNIGTDTILGRDTVGSGPPEQLTLDATMVWSGTGSFGRAAVTGDITIAAGSNTSVIAAGVIVNADINAAAAIAHTKLANLAGLSVLGRSANTTGALAAITAAVDGQILARVGTALAFSTLLTAGITDGAVTFPKFQDINTDRLIGRDTTGVGDVEEIALDPTLEFTGSSSIRRAAISGDITIAAGSNTADITAGVIVDSDVNAAAGIAHTKLATIATDSLLGRDSLGTGALEPLTVTGGLEFTGLGGIQRSALTGDVTAPAGSNTTTIAPDSVTFAKFQNINTDRLLGRDTTGSGDVEEIALDATLVWSGTGSIGRAAITGDITIAAGSNTSAIAAGVIVNADINAAAAIALSKLATQAALSVVANATNATAVPTAVAAAVDGQVFMRSGTTLVFSTLVTPSLTDGSVTFAKFQDITTDRLIGRDTAGTGDVEEIALDATLEFTGSASIRRAALTGDVTASAGSNATTIANNVVTLAKFQTIATDSLLGRDTVGTGNVEVIGLNATLEFTGTGSLQRAAISGDITIAAGSNSSAITAGVIVDSDVNAAAAIAFTKLATIATDSLLGRDTTGTGALETIGLNVTLSMTGAGALQRAALTGDVTAAAGSNATTLAANIVTFAKFQQITTDRLLGRDTAGTGNVEEIALDTTLEFTGSTSIRRAAISGDITIAAGSNSSAITAGVIVDADVNAAAGIAFTKLATIATDSLLGRDTTGTGALETIGLNTTLSMTGAGALQRAALTGDVTAAAGSNTTAIAAGVIVDADINAAAAIALSKLATQAALTVVANGTNATAVPTAIAAAVDGQIFMRVGTTLVFGTLVTGSITDGSVTLAKLADGTACSVLGRSANSTGPYADISIGTNDHVLKRTSNVVGSGFIVNANVDAAAAIAGTKVAPNFGAQNIVTTLSLTAGTGITNTGAYAGGTNPSTAGIIRLPNGGGSGDGIQFRDGTNTANIKGLAVSSGNTLVLGDATDTAITLAASSDTINLISGGATQLSVTTTTADFQDNSIVTTSFIALGASPATSGAVRLTNNEFINFRASGGTTVTGIGMTAGDRIAIGSSSASILAQDYGVGSTGTYSWAVGGVNKASLSTSVFEIVVATFRFDTSVVTPGITQQGDATAGVTGQLMVIEAQGVTGISNPTGGTLYVRGGVSLNGSGGALELRSGQGASATQAGTLNLRIGGTVVATWAGTAPVASTGTLRLPNAGEIVARDVGNTANLTIAGTDSGDGFYFAAHPTSAVTIGGGRVVMSATAIEMASGIATLRFDTAITGPTITQEDDAGAFPHSAQKLTIKAQRGVPINVTGGELSLESGLGGAAPGQLTLKVGANTLVQLAQLSSASIIALGGAVTATQMPVNSGNVVVWLKEATTRPTANPTGGIIMYVAENETTPDGLFGFATRSDDGVMRLGYGDLEKIHISTQTYPSVGQGVFIDGSEVEINGGASTYFKMSAVTNTILMGGDVTLASTLTANGGNWEVASGFSWQHKFFYGTGTSTGTTPAQTIATIDMSALPDDCAGSFKVFTYGDGSGAPIGFSGIEVPFRCIGGTFLTFSGTSFGSTTQLGTLLPGSSSPNLTIQITPPGGSGSRAYRTFVEATFVAE